MSKKNATILLKIKEGKKTLLRAEIILSEELIQLYNQIMESQQALQNPVKETMATATAGMAQTDKEAAQQPTHKDPVEIWEKMQEFHGGAKPAYDLLRRLLRDQGTWKAAPQKDMVQQLLDTGRNFDYLWTIDPKDPKQVLKQCRLSFGSEVWEKALRNRAKIAGVKFNENTGNLEIVRGLMEKGKLNAIWATQPE